MPTKRNKAGEQQNYVPQGNGDASGEYADQETGSNIHFTNFKKPDDEEQSGLEKEVQKGFENFGKGIKQEFNAETIKKDIRNNLVSRFGVTDRDDKAAKQDFCEKMVDSLNDDGLQKMNEYLNQNQSLKMKLGGSGRNAAGCAWGYGEINLDDTSPHVMKHEIGHTFDNFYGKDLPSIAGHTTYMSKDYASNKFVDPEFDKTMNEMLHDELGIHNVKASFSGWHFSFRKEGKDSSKVKQESMQRIADVYTKYCDKIFDRDTGVQNARQVRDSLQAKDNNAWIESRNQAEQTPEGIAYKDAKRAVWAAEDRYREEMRKKGAFAINFSESQEVQAARKLRDDAEVKMSAIRQTIYEQMMPKEEKARLKELNDAHWKVYRKMRGVGGIVGDVANYMNVSERTPYQVNGHSNSYFKDRGDGGFSLEIFANMFDSYMSKDPIQMECIREMFPKSSKIFEKIYNKKFN